MPTSTELGSPVVGVSEAVWLPRTASRGNDLDGHAASDGVSRFAAVIDGARLEIVCSGSRARPRL